MSYSIFNKLAASVKGRLLAAALEHCGHNADAARKRQNSAIPPSRTLASGESRAYVVKAQ
jgi:hypothetical protein